MPKKRYPRCRSINTKKHGSYHTHSLKATGKRQRKIQRCYCLDCHKSFSQRAIKLMQKETHKNLKKNRFLTPFFS